jgi:ABC-type lipoprotein release transport system permease subunit
MIPRLAWRNIWRNKRRTIITVLSIGLGLTFAIFFITLAEGAYHQMVRDGVRMQAGHITLEHKDYRIAPAVDLYLSNPGELRSRIESLRGVESTKLLIMGQGVAKSGTGAVGVAIMGVEPSVELLTSPIARRIKDGEYLGDDDGSSVVIGSTLARRLKLDLGKKMVITTNDANGELVEELCRVKGIFETGSEEIDGYLVQATVGFARELFVMPEGSTSQLGVILVDQNRLKRVLPEIRAMVNDSDAVVLTWREVMPELAAYITIDRSSNYIFQAILIGLILFTIFNTILMSVLERRQEFAILLAIGTPPRRLQTQVLVESAFLGLIGVGVGLILGGLLAYYFQVRGLDMSSLLEEGISISGLAMETKMHAKLCIPTILKLGGLVFLATLLLSLVPMRRAANTPFTDVLR